jgi:hypothetical protein
VITGDRIESADEAWGWACTAADGAAMCLCEVGNDDALGEVVRVWSAYVELATHLELGGYIQ